MVTKEPKALPAPNLGGRPTKLTEEVIVAICKSLEGGVFAETAAAKEGISLPTFRSWLRRGAREQQAGVEDSLHVKFLLAVKEADAFAEDRLTMHASKAAEKHYMAAFILLERRWPQRWRRPTDDRENKRAVMEAVLKAVIDTIRLVREARPGMTDDELVAHVFDNIELPFEDAPEPTSPRDAAATAPQIVINLPGAGGGNGPRGGKAPATGPVIDAEVVETGGLEAQRTAEAEKVLKEKK